MSLVFLLGQQAPQSSDFWSKLLGIERVNLKDGDWSVAWHHMPPPWVLFLVIVPAVLLLVSLIYRCERRDVGTGPKVLLTLLRALSVVLILLLLMGPVLTVETIKSRKAFLIVLLDESRSMQRVDLLQTDAEREAISKATGVNGVEEVKRLTRAEIVRKVLENPRLKILEDLEEKLNVNYFTFSSSAGAKESREKLLEGYSPQNCVGAETAIGDGIKAAMNSLKGQVIAGVVIFTDGKNNAGIATKEIAAQLRQRYLPAYPVLAGIPHDPKDIALLELEARDAVLANDELKIAYKVSGTGYENQTVDIGLWIYSLKEKDKDLGQDPKDLDRLIEESRKEVEQQVAIQGNGQKQPLSLVYSPKTPGEYLLILKANPRADESTIHNNYLTHRLRVADDKIKVLYVEHPPRYEYRFLKNALVRDKKLLVHCLLTSADEGFPQEHSVWSDDPLFRQPLQEFPKDLKTLLEFDVIIFGDVDPGKLGPDAAKHIEAFVTEFGGGIIFISGMMYNPRTLVNTPLANVLPVVPEESRDFYEHDKIFSETFGYQLTPDGRNHPITNFKEFKGDRDKNLEHWENRAGRRDAGMIGIRWFHRVKKLKAGASPLVELTGVPGETARPPVFVTQYAGRGRVFWSATDETWLWRFLVGDYPWFYPFWQQAMYWVREGKLLGARRYRVSVDKDRYTRGETVKVNSNAYDEKFEPKTDDKITVFIDPPSGDRKPLELHKDQNRNGYYEGEFIPSDTGAYKLWAGEEDESTRASTKFVVYIPDREDDDPKLDPATLKELAQESYGGRFFPIEEVHQLNETIKKSENTLRESKEDDLWDSPLVYLLFALLITAEWILRKIFRML